MLYTVSHTVIYVNYFSVKLEKRMKRKEEEALPSKVYNTQLT